MCDGGSAGHLITLHADHNKLDALPVATLSFNELVAMPESVSELVSLHDVVLSNNPSLGPAALVGALEAGQRHTLRYFLRLPNSVSLAKVGVCGIKSSYCFY